MFARFNRFRRRDPELRGTVEARADPPSPSPPALPTDTRGPDDRGDAAVRDRPVDQAAAAPVPEQPIPLRPLPTARHATVGVVLPARGPGPLLRAAVLSVPRVPKRAIFAAGICAGLAAPSVTRQLAARALIAALGPGRRAASAASDAEMATLEIIRVTYASSQRGQAAATLSKLLERFGR